MAKSFVGTVSSNAADKTIVVTVNTSKTHPIYRKQYTVSKKFMAHDEKNDAQVGDRVSIVETRPISKRKKFLLKKVIEKAAVQHVEAEVPAEVAEVVEKAPKEKAVKDEAPAKEKKSASAKAAKGETAEAVSEDKK
jgi:small subunit ribosomal protein S17